MIFYGSELVKAVHAVANHGYKKATGFVDEKTTVVVSRRFKYRKNEKSVEMVVTVGKPNARNREWIKTFKKAGEPFPVTKILTESWK